ncbi:MAG: hypothetical protein IKZ38_02745 [Clostridia bacterium]|nr:hypothetical protein [Clostridia bacterium]
MRKKCTTRDFKSIRNRLQKKAFDTKGSMKLTGVNDSIMEVFDITGFLDILTIE